MHEVEIVVECFREKIFTAVNRYAFKHFTSLAEAQEWAKAEAKEPYCYAVQVWINLKTGRSWELNNTIYGAKAK